MINSIYGINVAVKNLDAAIARYEGVFGVKAERLGAQDFAFAGLIGAKLNVSGFFITLVGASSDETSVAKFLERRGEGLFLLSVRTDAIEKDTKALEAQGLRFILDRPATGDFGAVNFVHPKSMHGVQLEMFQPGER